MEVGCGRYVHDFCSRQWAPSVLGMKHAGALNAYIHFMLCVEGTFASIPTRDRGEEKIGKGRDFKNRYAFQPELKSDSIMCRMRGRLEGCLRSQKCHGWKHWEAASSFLPP